MNVMWYDAGHLHHFRLNHGNVSRSDECSYHITTLHEAYEDGNSTIKSTCPG